MLPIRGIEEAADGVELAEVHQKDHHGRIRGAACQRLKTTGCDVSKKRSRRGHQLIATDSLQATDFMDSIPGLIIMTVRERHNRVNMYHCLRDDMVVLLPHLAYRNSTIGYGDGAVVAREDATTIGTEVLRMIGFCATVDTKPLEEKQDAVMDRLRRGIELSHDEYFPTFDNHIPDNWGRIYERYPALLHNYRVLNRCFSSAEIDDAEDSDSLTLSQLQVIRRGKERGIYTTVDVMTVPRAAGAAAIGGLISERLNCWRPKRSFFGRLTA